MTIDVNPLNAKPNANQVRIFIQHSLFFQRFYSFFYNCLTFIKLKGALYLCGQYGNLESLSEHPLVV